MLEAGDEGGGAPSAWAAGRGCCLLLDFCSAPHPTLPRGGRGGGGAGALPSDDAAPCVGRCWLRALAGCDWLASENVRG